MNVRTLFSSMLLWAGIVPVFGQDYQQHPIKKVSIDAFYIQTGMLSQSSSHGTLNDFKVLNPQSELLKSDLSEYRSFRGFNMGSNAVFSMMLGMHFNLKQNPQPRRSNPELRIGLSYFSGSILNGSLQQRERRPYDTLVSTQTGAMYNIDSVVQKNIDMNYGAEQLRLDASLLFSTNTKARWSIYSGIGITAGVSFNAHTDIDYREHSFIETNHITGNQYYSFNYYGSGESQTVNQQNKSTTGFSTYIPLGVDFRIGRKREFWKRMHLYYELRPGLNVISIPELRTITSAGIQHGLGLKVSWK